MKTIFLQISEEKYRQLVEALCVAVNYTGTLQRSERDLAVRKELESEVAELLSLLNEVGEQGSSQVREI